MKIIGLILMFQYACLYTNAQNSVVQTLLLMENEVAESAVTSADHGSQHYWDVKSEYAAVKSFRDASLQGKTEKLQFVLQKMDSVEQVTAEFINYIDLIKKSLIKKLRDEPVANTIVYETNSCRPAKFDLSLLNDLVKKVPAVDSAVLAKKILAYKVRLMQICGTYSFGNQNYSFPNKNLTSEPGSQAYKNELRELAYAETVNIDDRMILMDLFRSLDQTITKTLVYSDGAFLTNYSLLTVIQNDILQLRSLAMANWKSKVSTGLLNFNKVMAVVEGPEWIQKDEQVTFEVFIAATDTTQLKELKLNEIEGLQSTVEGSKLTCSSSVPGVYLLKGTIAFIDKSGVPRSYLWEKEIKVGD